MPIQPGEFMMGSPDSDKNAKTDEKPAHPLRITRPLYLGKYEVTVGQFRRFVESSGYRTDAERDGKGSYVWNEAEKLWALDPTKNWRQPGFPQNDDHSVVNVGWDDSVAFCEWLVQNDGHSYRLSTEAEWEYACRAGTTTRYWSADEAKTLASAGNVADATAKGTFPNWQTFSGSDGFVYTAPVGRFRANAFGLYDTHGNVWEWCGDWYAPNYYSVSLVDDPRGPSRATLRVFRGGGWFYFPADVRSPYRRGFTPATWYPYVGFRVARVQSGG